MYASADHGATHRTQASHLSPMLAERTFDRRAANESYRIRIFANYV